MNTVANALTVDHEVTAPAKSEPVNAVALTPMEMVGRALELGVPAEVLKQMMDLRDREEAREAKLAFTRAEPHQVFRRPFGLSYAAMAGASSMA